MSYIHPIDTSPNLPTTRDGDHVRGEDGFQTTAASPSTSLTAQNPIAPDRNTVIHYEGSSSNLFTLPSPSNGSRHRLSPLPSPLEGQEGAAPVGFAPTGYNEGLGGDIASSSALAGHTNDNLRRLAEAQQQPPIQTNLSESTNTSISGGGSSRAISPAGWLKRQCEELRKKQEELQTNVHGPSRIPLQSDFPRALSMQIVSPVQPVESCILLMHNLANNESHLEDLVQTLKTKQPESAFILLRGLQPVQPGNSGYDWADANATVDEGFINTSRVILEDIIQDGLMAKCGFQPRDIVILGHGQGGMAALAATACWNCIEFGGVVSLGGPMPGYVQLPFNVKAKTPVLIYGVARGDITPTALQQIQKTFSFTDHHVPPSEHDTVPESNEIAPLLEFFAHRLRREEWKRQAVISLDGGGIRGYGSLLILQDLMNRVGALEKILDETTESSFSPCDYKPRTVEPANTGGTTGRSLPSRLSEPPDVGAIGPTRSHDLPNSALFLPCHYFTYAAGSSTGGLISIMLSRFRMSVDDCIEEYKTLGQKVFEHPRRMAKGGFPWHRFNARVLEEVVRGVTSRHNKQSDDFGDHYGMESADEDKCQCIVLAYSSHVGGEFPYLFRTYGNQAPPRDPSMSRSRQRTFRNPGSASMLSIWKVARATSAAPGYFAPIKIETGNGSEVITFKDAGFGSNNPSEEAYRDIINKHGGIIPMGPFISIGTGKKPPLKMFSKRPDKISDLIANLNTVLHLPSRTEPAHERMLELAYPDGEERFPYFRFDGGSELGEVDLGEWESHRFTRITGKDRTSGRKTLEKIEAAVAHYLQQQDVQRNLKECARLLVNRRRLRTRNASDWDRYASYSQYVCDIKDCPNRRVNTAHDFKAHLRECHRYKLADPVIEKKTLECRSVQWIYRPKDPAPESTARN